MTWSYHQPNAHCGDDGGEATPVVWMALHEKERTHNVCDEDYHRQNQISEEATNHLLLLDLFTGVSLTYFLFYCSISFNHSGFSLMEG